MFMVCRSRFGKTEHTTHYSSRDPTQYYRNEFLRGVKADGCYSVLISLAKRRPPPEFQETRAFLTFAATLLPLARASAKGKKHG